MGRERDGILLGGVGSDIFGIEGTARVVPFDRANEGQRYKLLISYLSWQKQSHKFHDTFEHDIKHLAIQRYQTYGFFAAGVVFEQ
jgi:hypothetical protein